MSDRIATTTHEKARAANEHYYAYSHAVGAALELLNLQKKLQAAPWLKRMPKFCNELKIAELRAERTARIQAYWEDRIAELEEKYDPNQPRAPAGNPEGGQWTYVAGYAKGRSRKQELQDFRDYLRTGRVTAREGVIVEATLRPRGGGGHIGAEFPNSTLGQRARLVAAEAEARESLRLVRQVDPSFQPKVQSATAQGSIEGAIANQQAIAQAARARLAEIHQSRVPLRDILMPGGRLIGERHRNSARSETRTLLAKVSN